MYLLKEPPTSKKVLYFKKQWPKESKLLETKAKEEEVNKMALHLIPNV
jgi:hypothetical protein